MIAGLHRSPEMDRLTELHRRLHDGVLQLLEFMSTGGLGTIDAATEYRRLASSAAADLRAVIEQPAGSFDAAFPVALQRVVDRVPHKGPDMELRLEVCAGCTSVDADEVQPLLLATGEAVLNAVRHSGGNRIFVSCTRADETLNVDVLDNGVGLPEGYRPGFGVSSSIVGRITEAGGCARISNRRVRGAHVHLELPLAARPELQRRSS
ncbi:MAG: liaS [Thermoleophilia bacterium]|nr:liaS [Thermoleophilia bacterium]